MINIAIKKLVTYGLEQNLINFEDKVFVINRILELLNLDGYKEPEGDFKNISLKEPLEEILRFAIESKLIQDNQESRDFFDTKIMNILTPTPSAIIQNFKKFYKISPKKAVNWFYKLSQDTNFIRKDRLSENLSWSVSSKYGKFDFVINSLKPETDFDELLKIQTEEEKVGYPKCALCVENEGFAGKKGYPARNNLRMIPITLNNEDWYFNYSPYNYFPEHFVAFNAKHVPLKINSSTFTKIFEFMNIFPHYFVGFDADLPIVGSSILFHEHIIGGNYECPIAKADVIKRITIKHYEDIQAGILRWPLTTIRLKHTDYRKLVKCADKILGMWRNYSDDSAQIYNFTDGKLHNTITSVARKTGDMFELDLILRNNAPTEDYPFGIFHSHPEYHHITKENLAFSEAMGFGIFRASLKSELDAVVNKILNGEDLRADNLTAKHATWVEKFIVEYDDISDDNIWEIIKTEIGKEFEKMLECAAVFKQDEKGQYALDKFISQLNGSV